MGRMASSREWLIRYALAHFRNDVDRMAAAIISVLDEKDVKRLERQCMRLDPSHRYHGTAAGYGTGCRCPRCTRAQHDYTKAEKERVRRELEADPDDPRHGTYNGGSKGCRCERCRAAVKEKNSEYRERARNRRRMLKE